MQTTFTIHTNGQGLYEFTDQVTSWVRGSGVLTLFIQHTSASIL
ncbi:MAG: YjbQ family protein, partial [Paracoccaceae bacterium]